ncbi:hypothetical protein [Cryobacterium sp. MDB2-33-2]|uniref:hypothetical protein n=1 Tax=Cryobacterium sp. MDB2-33-2 TaxID=1259179 RepID=UPI0010699066|nr:hypothetical protein [Cryobacterium sp. MDB2-33-2]
MLTQVVITCFVGTFGVLLVVHGVFIVSNGNFDVSNGDNVVGGFIYLAIGLLLVLFELGVLAFRVWLFRRVKVINATELGLDC